MKQMMECPKWIADKCKISPCPHEGKHKEIYGCGQECTNCPKCVPVIIPKLPFGEKQAGRN